MHGIGFRGIVVGGVLAFYGIILFLVAFLFLSFPMAFTVGTFFVLLLASALYFTYGSLSEAENLPYCHTEIEVAFHKMGLLNDIVKCASSWILIIIAIVMAVAAKGVSKDLVDGIVSVFVFFMLLVLPVVCMFQILCYKHIQRANFYSYMNHIIFLLIAWFFVLLHVVDYSYAGVLPVSAVIGIFLLFAIGTIGYGIFGIFHFLWKKSAGVRRGHLHFWFYVAAGGLESLLGSLILLQETLSFGYVVLLFILVYMLLSVIDDKVASL